MIAILAHLSIVRRMDDTNPLQAIGGRIAAFRDARRITQADLAKVINRDPSVVTKIEAGQRGINSYELALIADALAVTMDELLGRSRVTAPMKVAARIAQTRYPIELRGAIGRVRRLFELEALLDRIAPGDKVSSPPDVAPSGRGSAVEQGAELALDVRKFLKLGDLPISDLPQLIEQKLGMDVAIEPLPTDIDGLCVQVEGSALAVANAGHLPGRRRFTLAHEVCHRLSGDAQELVVESMFAGSASPEKRANAFAAHFLMPPTAIRQFIGKDPISAGIMAKIMLVFGVSLQAATWHLYNLRVISGNERLAYASQQPGSLFYRAGLWAEWQAASKSLEIRRPPARLQERALNAYTMGAIGIGPLADLFEAADAEILREDLRQQGVVPPSLEPILVAPAGS